jgi:catechol 2,3-dioxygenase-like lactoylglutathione lyase family enzyme
MTPSFIVRDVPRSVSFYVDRLGFELRTAIGVEGEDPFFALVGRDAAQLMVKSTPVPVDPMPNHLRHEWVAWDAFVYVADPDSLALEYADGNVMSADIRDWEDGLRGFEVQDPDGYVLFFGRPTDS